MKQILLGLLIVLIIAPVAYAETCYFRLEINEEDTCGNYKIRQDGWSPGDQRPYQITHFHLWRLSPPADLGSDFLDMLHVSEKYYDGDKLYVYYRGYSTDPLKAKYTIRDLTPQLVVRGNLYYTDRNLNDVPMKWATVGLWDYDYSDGSYDNLSDYVLTNETGYFEFNPVENADWDEDGGKLDIVVQFIAGSGAGCVRDANNEIYGFWQGPYPDVSDELCMSWHTPDDETHYKAWWVYNTLCDGWEYLSDTVGYDMNYVGVYWQWNHDADFGCGIDTTHSHPRDNPPHVHLDGRNTMSGDPGGSANDPDVIIHEYGHCVMYKVFGDYYPPHDCSSGHHWAEISEPGCAWTEGWAHFSALAVFNDEYFTDTTYNHSINLETRDGGTFPDGDSCEGNVAAALWDIYDEHDEMYDRLWDNFSNIWHVLHNQTTDEDTFSDFYVSWCDLDHDKPKANAAIFQNDIDYNLPPGVVVSNPEPGHDYLGIIQTLTYTTDEDGDVPHTEYWYSLDNINWNQLDLPIGKGGCSTLGEEKWWYADWDTTLYIDEDDSVWLRVYATDNLEAVSSDDTDGPFTVDNVAPHHWQDFTPSDWVADQTPDCTIEAKDITAGLDVSTARYKYSTNGGSSWSGWTGASCTGEGGTTSYQTITASAVPFNHDSETQNKIKFKIDDMVGNTGYSSEYTVKINSTSGVLWTCYSSRIDTETECLGLGGFAIDSEDNVIIASNRDVIKYDSNGNVLWEYDMCGCGVVVDKTDDSVIVGLCNSSVIKFSKTGSILWTRALQEDLYLSGAKSVNPSGDILVSGFGRVDGVFKSYYEIRDKNGNFIRSTTRPQNGWWPSAAFAESGYIYLAYDLAQGVAIEKVPDDFSSTLWTATLHNCSHYIGAMGVDSENNLFARGTTGVGGVGYNQYTAKIDGINGDLMWEKIYDSGYQDFGGGLTIDSANNILVIGSTDYETGGKDKAGILMIKYDGSDGTELKHILYRKSPADERFEVACGIVRDSNGYVYIGGKEYDISAGEGCGIETRRALTIKYDPI